MIQVKGAKVLIEEIERESETVTSGGLVVSTKEESYPDKLLWKGRVVGVGTPEIDLQGIERKPDVERGIIVWFNRRNALIAITKDKKRLWLVDCRDIWAVGEI